jgi:hypothetical protein
MIKTETTVKTDNRRTANQRLLAVTGYDTLKELNESGESVAKWISTPTGDAVLMYGEGQMGGGEVVFYWTVAATVHRNGELTLETWVTA